MLVSFDHVNVRTANLDKMIAFYSDVLGLENGYRPKFDVDGAWMYMGDKPVVHLVDVKEDMLSGAEANLTLEHFAFTAKGFASFSKVLDDAGIPCEVVPVPAIKMVQVNLRDPDGNHIHIDFMDDDQG